MKQWYFFMFQSEHLLRAPLYVRVLNKLPDPASAVSNLCNMILIIIIQNPSG